MADRTESDETMQAGQAAQGADPGGTEDKVGEKSVLTWLKGSRLNLKMPEQTDADGVASIASPMHWSDTTKLLMGLAVLVSVFSLVYLLQSLIAPTLLALILVLVLTPIVRYVEKTTGWRERTAIIVVYLVILTVLTVIVLAVGGRLLESLVNLANSAKAFRESVLAAEGASGSPITVVFSNVMTVAAKLLAGAMLVTANLIGWGAYILAVSFFTMIERKPAEDSDLSRRLLGGLGSELDRLRSSFSTIWSTWIYGQVILSIMTFISYFIAMSLLGLENSLGIAVVSMLGRFIPYIGATVTWCLVALTAYTQTPTPFGLEPVTYMVLCVGVAIVVDQAFDQFVTPRLYGGVYKIPTAVVLIGTFAAGIVMGFFGMFVAAPLMATVVLVGEFVMSRVIEAEPAEEAVADGTLGPAPGGGGDVPVDPLTG